MNLSEYFFRKKPKSEIAGLHQNFQVKEDDWFFNRRFDEYKDSDIGLKARFSFDDPSFLDDCPFFAKIGLNEDGNLPGKYIGFAYGKRESRNDIVAWARKFPYAELIDNLSHDGDITKKSNVTVVQNGNNSP